MLSGDTGQHASVTHGDALRILEQYSGYRFSELTTIRRQKPEAFRQIVELAAAKQTDKAFAKLLELGAVTEAVADGPEASLYDKAAQTYLSAVRQRQERAVRLFPLTWLEIEAVTDKVRDALKAGGRCQLRRNNPPAVFDSAYGRKPQRRTSANTKPGHRIRFCLHRLQV